MRRGRHRSRPKPYEWKCPICPARGGASTARGARMGLGQHLSKGHVERESRYVCSGQLHPGGVVLDAKAFYYPNGGRRAGRPIKPCRACRAALKGHPHELTGYIDAAVVWPRLAELARDVGVMETSRRTGVTYETISSILKRERPNVHKRTAKLILEAWLAHRRDGAPYRESRGAHRRYHPRRDGRRDRVLT